MGKTARWEVEQGRFSIKGRNEKLKRIFDEACGNLSDHISLKEDIID
jgi:hypothetical protein